MVVSRLQQGGESKLIAYHPFFSPLFPRLLSGGFVGIKVRRVPRGAVAGDTWILFTFGKLQVAFAFGKLQVAFQDGILTPPLFIEQEKT